MATLPSRGRVQARQRATVSAANHPPGSTTSAADTVACNGQANNRSHADGAAPGTQSANAWGRASATADAAPPGKKACGQKQHAKKQRRWVKKDLNESSAAAPTKTDVEDTDVPGSAAGTGDEHEQDTPKQRDQPGSDALDRDLQAALSVCSTDTDPVNDGEPMYSKFSEQEAQDDRLHRQEQEPEQQEPESQPEQPRQPQRQEQQQLQQQPQEPVEAQHIPSGDEQCGNEQEHVIEEGVLPKAAENAISEDAYDSNLSTTRRLLEAAVRKAMSRGENPPTNKKADTTHELAMQINLEKLVGDQLPDPKETFRLSGRGKNKQPHQGAKDAAFAGVPAEWPAARGAVGHGRGTTRSSSAVPLATIPPPNPPPLTSTAATPFLLPKAAKPMRHVFINNLATAPKAPTAPITLFQDPVAVRETPVLLGRTAHDRTGTPKHQVQVISPCFADDSVSTQAEIGDAAVGASSSSSNDGDALAPQANGGDHNDSIAGVEGNQPSDAEEVPIEASSDMVLGGPAEHSIRVLVGFLHLEPQCLQESVRHIVNEGWANITWKKKYTALHLAAEFGRHDVLPLLIALQADPSAVDVKGRTALEVASSKQNWDCVRLLTKMTSYRSPSKSVVAQEMVKLLDIKHARLSKAVQHIVVDGWDTITWRNQYTALHLAAFLGREDVAMMLVGLGGDASLVDSKGRTPADVARERQHWGCAWTLSHVHQNAEDPVAANVAAAVDTSVCKGDEGSDVGRKALRLRKDRANDGDAPAPRDVEAAQTQAGLAQCQQPAARTAQPCWMAAYPTAAPAAALRMRGPQADMHTYMLNAAGLQDWMALHRHKEFRDIAGF